MNRESADVFQSSAWLEASAGAVGGWVIEPPGLTGLRLLARRVGPFTVCGAPLAKTATPLSAGLHGAPADVAEQLRVIGAWWRGSGLSLLQVTSPYPVPDDAHVSRVEGFSNLEIDLRPDCSELWKGMSDLPRRMIRRALRDGVRVSRVRLDARHLEAHRQISEAMFQAQREPPIVHPVQYRALLETPLGGNAQLFAATCRGRPLGHLLALVDPSRAYYWDVAIDDDGRRRGAGHLLFWAWMRWCKRHGISRADLMGSMDGGRAGTRGGIGRFKQSFGAQSVDYHVAYWHTRWAGRALDVSRAIARARRVRTR